VGKKQDFIPIFAVEFFDHKLLHQTLTCGAKISPQIKKE
jgi:hypothetical protein